MNTDEALQTFIVESGDLLQQMEDALLAVEHQADTAESVAAIFRAAHTIKGSAGLFGLDAIVSFTHVVESVLDRVRSAELAISKPLIALLLEARDHIGRLVGHAAGDALEADAVRRGEALTARLGEHLPRKAMPPAGPAAPAAAAKAADEGEGVVSDAWHISLRFGTGVLADGMDPVACLRYLGTLGTIERIETLTERVPPLEETDPEACYLGFEIRFRSEADKRTIEGAFDFVRESSRISILPPHSRAAEYVALIRDEPEADARLGQILVRCGSLTEAELAAALDAQRGEAGRPIGEVLVADRVVEAAVIDAALDKQKQLKETRGGDANFIRVDARRLDLLINLVGELIITGAGAHLIAQRLGDGDLLETTFTMSRLVEEVRDSALNLRMVQIGATFNRFQRVVHDVSRELGKDIQLEISGEETELDKTVVERIGDPLTHLVRNAMDHGIEPAEVRVAAGKPARGTLKLNAYHDSASIVIEVADDGGGLNSAKILAKARERGLVGPNDKLSDAEIRRLIFEPGFSTADKVSNLSGRGVGMDVVRRNIEALRGTIDLESEEGKGTAVRIHLPLTLAIIDGFLVGVGDATYVVPLDMVVECIELTRPGARREWDDDEGEDSAGDTEDLSEAVNAHDGNYLNLRGEVLPYLKLHEALDVPGEPPLRQSIIVVQFGGHKVGLVVDRLLGEFQTVIKPLSRLFARLRGVSGSTILGTGEVALILDVPALVQTCVAQAALAFPAAQALPPTAEAAIH